MSDFDWNHSMAFAKAFSGNAIGPKRCSVAAKIAAGLARHPAMTIHDFPSKKDSLSCGLACGQGSRLVATID
ncbi:hypothetical protein Pan97_53330 [Bremerella volcania]|uniref:Uncharacterized protein n=1 Tax=Bremerella volcania TaxID=2527984 RepID=A0A518CG97_9BACT|nr:hypothetical protein Pan97_53330 [Bremerella volcania]